MSVNAADAISTAVDLSKIDFIASPLEMTQAICDAMGEN